MTAAGAISSQASSGKQFAADFDGTYFLDGGAVHLYDRTDAFTVVAWVYFDSTSFNFASCHDGTDGWRFATTSGNDVRVRLQGISPDVSLNILTNTTIAVGWHHIAVAKGTTAVESDVDVYIDGIIQTVTISSDDFTSGSMQSGSNQFNIGSYGDGTVTTDGRCSTVAIYTSKLSVANVTRLFGRGRHITTDKFSSSPVSVYDLRKPSQRTSIADEGSASNTLTFNNGGGGATELAYQRSSSLPVMQFDGSTDNIEITGPVTKLDFGITEPFSVSVWVRAASTGSTQPICGNLEPSTTFQGWEFQIGSAGYPQVFLIQDFGVSEYVQVSVNEDIADDNWHHLCFTWDGNIDGNASGVTIYVDNVSGNESITTDGLTSGDLIVSTDDFYVGERTSGTGSFDGYMSELVIYSSEITAANVLSFYKKAYPLSLGAVSMYYSFSNDMEGSTMFSGSTDTDGTINGSPIFTRKDTGEPI